MGFRLKTFPEILSNMFAILRGLQGENVDLNIGSVIRTILEAAALNDADQYVQISKLLDLFSLDTAQGDDLDRRAQDYGTDIFPPLRRNPAKSSIVFVSVSDGSILKKTLLATDTAPLDPTFTVAPGTGASFPVSGKVTLERGTAREETVIYTSRVGDVFTTQMPLANAHAAVGEVLYVSVSSTLAATYPPATGAVTLAMGTGTAWVTPGSVVFEQGTAREELRTYTRVGDVLTLGVVTTFSHAIDTVVVKSTVGSDRAITASTAVYAPAAGTSAQIAFHTTAAGALLDGQFTSTLIPAESDKVGADTRAGANTITKFTSVPFTGAVVTNPVAATRGADRETDSSYRQRIRDYIQSISQGTPLAIETKVVGLRDDVSNQEVAFAEMLEPVAPGLSLLYISDGLPTFVLEQVARSGRVVLISDAEAGDRRAHLPDYGPFAKVNAPPASCTPRLYQSLDRGVSTSVGVGYLEDTTRTWGTNVYAGFVLKTDDNQFYDIVSNTAIRLTLSGTATPSSGSYAIIDLRVGANPLVPDTDYLFNESTGDLELVAPGLVAHDALIAADDNAPTFGCYTYSTGLAAYVQRVVNGDPLDYTNFPGLRAAGSKIVVVAPTVMSPGFIIKVVAARGFSDAQLVASVLTVVQTYVNSLGIGDNIVLSEIVSAIMALPGVYDVVMIEPTANVTVPSGQLARITDANIEVV